MAITAAQSASTEVIALGSGWTKYQNGVIAPDQGTESINKLDTEKVYELGEFHNGTQWTRGMVESTEIPIPKKLIWSEAQRMMLESIKKKAEKPARPGTLGILLHGEPGSGKTVMAAIIARIFKAPLIKLKNDLTLQDVDKVLNSTKNDTMVLLMDDATKWNLKGDYAIKFFDQDTPSYRKIIILTSNSIEGMDERLWNRSRIHYNLHFEKIEEDIRIRDMVEEFKPKNIDLITDFAKANFETVTIDVIKMLIEELEDQGLAQDITLNENDIAGILRYMNIKTKKNAIKYKAAATKLTPHTTVEEFYNRALITRPNLAREQFEELFIQAMSRIMDPSSKEKGKQQYKKIFYADKSKNLERRFAHPDQEIIIGA